MKNSIPVVPPRSTAAVQKQQELAHRALFQTRLEMEEMNRQKNGATKEADDAMIHTAESVPHQSDTEDTAKQNKNSQGKVKTHSQMTR